MNARYKIWFVQCSICKAPVGAMEYFNAGAGVQDMKALINKLDNKIDNLESMIRRISR